MKAISGYSLFFASLLLSACSGGGGSGGQQSETVTVQSVSASANNPINNQATGLTVINLLTPTVTIQN